MSREAYNYKRYAIKAAKDLCYSKEIISQLQTAESESEIERIMITARKEN